MPWSAPELAKSESTTTTAPIQTCPSTLLPKYHRLWLAASFNDTTWDSIMHELFKESHSCFEQGLIRVQKGIGNVLPKPLLTTAVTDKQWYANRLQSGMKASGSAEAVSLPGHKKEPSVAQRELVSILCLTRTTFQMTKALFLVDQKRSEIWSRFRWKASLGEFAVLFSELFQLGSSSWAILATF